MFIDNLNAREAFTAVLMGSPIPTPQPLQLTAAQAQESLFGWVYKEPGMAQISHCRHTMQQIAERFGTGESLILLQRFGETRLDKLWMGNYAALVEFGQACLLYDTPPSSSWTNDNVPTYFRKLFWHPESDTLFEITDPAEYLAFAARDDIDAGHCSEVTGIGQHEDRFKEEHEL